MNRYQYADRTAFQILDGLAVVVATRKRMVHRFDDISTDLWRFLEPSRTVEELVEYLVSEYDVELETAQRDMTEFVEDLHREGLLQVVS
ncbi:MAG: PqqD family protein [Planctomycetota bacterium]|nr:PqqD family protein [Planctomycetota bacterium]